MKKKPAERDLTIRDRVIRVIRTSRLDLCAHSPVFLHFYSTIDDLRRPREDSSGML